MRASGLRIVAAVAFLVTTVVPPGATRDAAASVSVDGLSVEATTTYTLDVDAGVVRVRSDVTLTNTTSPVFTVGGYRYSYFDEFAIAAIGPTANVRASGSGTPLEVVVSEPDPFVDVIIVRLSSRLLYDAPQNLVIEYDLPGQTAGSDSPTRVNDAFASWYMAPVGDDGTTHAIVDIPERFTVNTATAATSVSVENDGRSVIRYDDLSEESSFFGFSASDDDRLLVRSTRVGDDRYEIQAWPDDEAWADFALDTVERGVPALVDLVGLDVDGERTITVAESGTPYLYGYAGWYSAVDDRIEVGDERDRHTMLHELAHLWYHDGLFSSRWVIEGLAEVAATVATAAFGEDPMDVPPLDAGSATGRSLNEWDHTTPGDTSDGDELYGYRTSFAVVHAIDELVGTDTMQSVVARAHRGELPFPGDANHNRPPLDDWRYFYDLLMTSPGVDTAAIDDLFHTYAMSDADREAARARVGAVETYQDLDEADGAWVPPLAVRRALAEWRFDLVPVFVDASLAVVDDAAELLRLVETLDVDAGAVATAYEKAVTLADLTAVRDDLPRFEAAARALTALDDRASGLGPLQRLGVAGRDLHGRAAAAEKAFEEGDLERMDDLITQADDILDQWPIVVVAWLGVISGVVGLIVVVRLRRARSRTDAAAVAAAESSLSAESADGVDDEPGETADDGAVDPDELEIPPEKHLEA